MHIYICIHIYTYIRIYIPTQNDNRTDFSGILRTSLMYGKHVCIYVYTYMYTHICIHIYIHM